MLVVYDLKGTSNQFIVIQSEVALTLGTVGSNPTRTSEPSVKSYFFPVLSMDNMQTSTKPGTATHWKRSMH